jgi:hypothetical protein
MLNLAAQIAVLLLAFTGGGYWVWLACGRPALGRGMAWLWSGFAGFCLIALALQALLFLDIPMRRTAPWALAVASLGVVAGVIHAWKSRPKVNRRCGGEWVGTIASAFTAMGIVACASWPGAPDRMLARLQPDQLNYVVTAQGFLDEKFSLDYDAIGLRPWLYRTVDAKRERITQLVVLAWVAENAGTDCQRAWMGVSLVFIGFLAAALFGLARVLAGMPTWLASGAAVCGATLAAVAVIYANGYFSQLQTLWTFAALPAISRPGALGRRTKLICLVAVGGFLAGAYTEFFPIGIATAAMGLLGSRNSWRIRWGEVVLVGGGALLLTTGYLAIVGGFFLRQVRLSSQPGFLKQLVTDQSMWLGWSHHFFAGSNGATTLAAGVLVITACTGIFASAPHRRRWWIAALAAPCLAWAYLLAQSPLQAYAFQKLTASYAPIVVLLAFSGVASGLATKIRGIRFAAGMVGIGLAAGCLISGIHLFISFSVPDQTALLWSVRDRVEAAPQQTYLLARGHPVIGAWLAFFARNSTVYSELPLLSDRRVASESQTFRKIPAHVSLTWLDLEKTGPVGEYEPSPQLKISGELETKRVRSGAVHILGNTAVIEIVRLAADHQPARGFELEMGIASVDPNRPVEVALISSSGENTWHVTMPTFIKVPLQLSSGLNRFELRSVATGGASDGPVITLGSVSLNRIDPLL